MKQSSQNIVGQLKIIFSLSTALLLASLVGSIYSTRQLIKNSELVNHTNEVLLQAENIMSALKDAETGQRGYLLTQDPLFLEPYNGAYSRTTEVYNKLLSLTIDNPIQQKNLIPMKERYEARFAQMQRIIDLLKRNSGQNLDPETMGREMRLGKKIMDDLRLMVNEIKSEENKIFELRSAEQQTYITYTPFFLVFAALVSIIITVFAFFRIKGDIETRLKKEREAELLYDQTRKRINQIEGVTKQIAAGKYDIRSSDTLDDELGRISNALNLMTAALEKNFTDLARKTWLQAGSLQIGDAMRGERIMEKLTSNILGSITTYLHAPIGTFYILDNDYDYKLLATFATDNAPVYIRQGEGLLGQAIALKDILIVENLPDNYLSLKSSLGATQPQSVVIIPLMYAFDCIGVLEIGFLKEPGEQELNYLRENREAIGIALNAALDYSKLQNFLEETQAQAEELQAQHNELENLNEELEIQSQKLQASDEELRVQQEELQQTNEELEERSSLLEERNVEILNKAKELEISTRYKSEFLANMSHELRTPLNSILLLSRLLKENSEENLSTDQVEYAAVINSSGNGLLALI